jgi:hypothetical protein
VIFSVVLLQNAEEWKQTIVVRALARANLRWSVLEKNKNDLNMIVLNQTPF